MFNPWISRTNRVTIAGNSKMPGISKRSKGIKKRDKQAITVVEEGEEGAEVEALESDIEQVIDEEERIAPGPLLGQYEKFPEFIELEIKPLGTITTSNILTAYNKYALNEILDQKTRELILLKSFPIVFRIYLVPALNILTIQKGQSDTSID